MYFGLFRIGELTKGEHPVLARDVQIGTNKKKILFILRSSKTHSKAMRPQQIKISNQPIKRKASARCHSNSVFSDLPCPYKLLKRYLKVRGTIYKHINEPFFVFADRSPVKPMHVRNCFELMLKQCKFKYPQVYRIHGIRARRACDMLRLGLSVEEIKKMGRWKSNAVYKYLKC